MVRLRKTHPYGGFEGIWRTVALVKNATPRAEVGKYILGSIGRASAGGRDLDGPSALR